MKFNVLLAVHQFLPEYFSGTEILTFGVAKELVRRGHRVSVLAGFPSIERLPDSSRFDEYSIEGIDVFRFHHEFVPMGGQTVLSELEYNNHLVARYFAQLLKRVRPDVVHVFHFMRIGAGLIDVAAAAEVPAYYTPTDFWSVCPTCQLILGNGKVCSGPTWGGGNCLKHIGSLGQASRVMRFAKTAPNLLVDAMVKLTAMGILSGFPSSREVAAIGQRKNFILARLNALHGIVSPTRLMTRVLTSNGVNRSLITQSAYGIDLAGYRSRVRSVPKNGAVTFGFIGTLQPHKGCHVLVDAFTRLQPDRAKLRVYGNTTESKTYFDTLQKKAGAMHSVEFCGTFPNDQMPKVMDSLDVLVVPSLWYENAPLVVHSAMAAKCPVVASNFPGLAEVVRHGLNGLMFQPGDVQDLSAKLSRLVDDPSLINNLSAKCSPPKSTGEYVDELMTLYADRHLSLTGSGKSSRRRIVSGLGSA